MTPARWAVVTGASRGIGAAIARRLAADGYAVALLSTNRDRLEGVAAEVRSGGGQAEVYVCDLADRQSLEEVTRELLLRHPAIAALVNNAGIVRVGSPSEQGGANWDAVMEVNLRACFELIRRLEPALRRAEDGASVVNISSVMGILSTPGVLSYVTAKGGLQHLTHGLVGTPEEVAAVVSFLCSADASFVSGAVLPVDGALTCKMAIPPIV